MAPPRSHRRAARPIYPGVLPVFVSGIAGFFVYRLGYRLPWHVPLWVRLLLEAVVVMLAWRTWKSFRAARRAELRLFQAQSMIAYAVALQALILLLRS
jgi:high-affinity Fe2+/Pb2+ permease